MEIINFSYNISSERALADPVPPNNSNIEVFSVSYPMLAKSISSAGNESPTGASTNSLILKRGVAVAVQITYSEGFPTISQLQSFINQAIIDAFPAVTTPLQLVLRGTSQMRWENLDTIEWLINYINPETKQSITGISIDPLTEIVLASASSPTFNPDPRLGLAQLELRITNGQSISIPSHGKWLDHILFYFTGRPLVTFKDVREVKLIATYSSIKITKELVCPRDDGIRLSIR